MDKRKAQILADGQRQKRETKLARLKLKQTTDERQRLFEQARLREWLDPDEMAYYEAEAVRRSASLAATVARNAEARDKAARAALDSESDSDDNSLEDTTRAQVIQLFSFIYFEKNNN